MHRVLPTPRGTSRWVSPTRDGCTRPSSPPPSTASAPPTPGFRALGSPDAGVVPVFSSVEQLALARGTVGWFSMTGADLLAQLPAGYDLVLDIAGQHPLRLHPGAVGVHATISLGAVTA